MSKCASKGYKNYEVYNANSPLRYQLETKIQPHDGVVRPLLPHTMFRLLPLSAAKI